MNIRSLICDVSDHKFINKEHEIKWLDNDGTNSYFRASNICSRCGKVIEWNFSVYDPRENNKQTVIEEWPL